MDRLSDWRAAAWIAFCFAAVASAAALILPAAFRDAAPRDSASAVGASLVPRTHLFGQTVTAMLELPKDFTLKTTFAPYRVVRRTITLHGSNIRYEFVLDCLRWRCVGPPGTERTLSIPPVRITLPTSRKLVAFWPPLREASRLDQRDLSSPRLRGQLVPPQEHSGGGRHGLIALLLGAGAALALCAAAALGLRWLAWRPSLEWSTNGHRNPSALDFALMVTRLTAGGGAQDRRAALESLAVALEERGLGQLAAEARRLAWAPRPPGGEAVRRLTEAARQAVKETA